MTRFEGMLWLRYGACAGGSVAVLGLGRELRVVMSGLCVWPGRSTCCS